MKITTMFLIFLLANTTLKFAFGSETLFDASCKIKCAKGTQSGPSGVMYYDHQVSYFEITEGNTHSEIDKILSLKECTYQMTKNGRPGRWSTPSGAYQLGKIDCIFTKH